MIFHILRADASINKGVWLWAICACCNSDRLGLISLDLQDLWPSFT